jgi:tight adherence protein B
MSNSALLLLLPVLTGMVLLVVRRNDRRRQFVERRLTAITADESSSEPVQRLSLLGAVSPGTIFHLPRKYTAQFNAAFAATGSRIGLLHLIAAALIAAVLVIGFVKIILALSSASAIPFGCVAAAVIPVIFLKMAQARYRRHFLDVFPDALDLVGRAVKAGLPVNEALATASHEIADPVGSELRRALDQVQIGVQMVEALQQIAARVRAADFRFMVVALALQSKTGGSLAETLANLSKVIRARKALRLKARALTAEAKASASVLAALPFIVGGAMWTMNRDLTLTLWVDPRGRFMLGVAFVSLVTGLTTMYVIVKRALR